MGLRQTAIGTVEEGRVRHLIYLVSVPRGFLVQLRLHMAVHGHRPSHHRLISGHQPRGRAVPCHCHPVSASQAPGGTVQRIRHHVVPLAAPLFVQSVAIQSAPTGYAAEHPIPKGLVCHTPMAEHADTEKAVNPTDSTTFLQIRKGIQGGIYEYSFYYPALPEGTIWLQCYEAGKNTPLSAREIKKKTSQKTEGTDRFTCLAENKEFTIYEGDWGEHYAARIEVWFKDKKGNKRKLLEKFYTVEGWSR